MTFRSERSWEEVVIIQWPETPKGINKAVVRDGDRKKAVWAIQMITIVKAKEKALNKINETSLEDL